MRAAGIITPPGATRMQGVLAALFIARRTKGADRLALLEACGLLPYEAVKLQARISSKAHTSYRRPGH